MTKSDLIKRLMSKYKDLSHEEMSLFVENIFSYIKSEIKQSNRVEIRRFGVFGLRVYKNKKSFNPISFQYKEIDTILVPYYKPSISLKRSINPHL